MAIEKPPRKGESQNMVIYPSKGKVLWGSVLSFLFTLVGIGIILSSLTAIPSLIFLSIMVGIPTLVFLGLGPLLYFFPIVLQAFASAPILVINDEGIRATIGSVSTLVKWEEISTIDLRKVGSGALFEVILSPEGIPSFLSRQRTSSRSRRSRRPHSRVIIVSQTVLPLSVKQLIETIQQRYQLTLEHYQIRFRP